GGAGGIGDDRPARPEIRSRLDRADAADFIHQQLANVFTLVVYHARVREHRVAAAARLPVTIHRHREAVRRLHDAPLVGKSADALPRRSGEIDVVDHAADHVVVVARDAVVDDRLAPPRLVGAEVAGGMLQVLAQLLARNPYRTERIL